MRALDAIYRVAAILAALLLASIAVLTLVQIVGRALGYLVSTGTEFAGFCMAASTFLALAWTLRSGGHIRVTLFVQKAQRRLRRWVEAFCLLIAIAATGVLSYSAVLMTWDSYRFGDVSVGLVPVPIWIPQLSMAFGTVLLTVALVEQLALVARGEEPTYRRFEDEEAGVTAAGSE